MKKNKKKINKIYNKYKKNYIIIIKYILKKLKRSKYEIKKFINDYIKIIDELRGKIPKNIFDQIILTNDSLKLSKLITFVKN